MHENLSSFAWRKASLIMVFLAFAQFVYSELFRFIPFPEGSLTHITFFIIFFLPQYILTIVIARYFFLEEKAGLPAGVMLALTYFAVLFCMILAEDIFRTLINASYRIAVIDSVLGSWPIALIIIAYSAYSGFRRV
ncbi:hypothetical protein A2765_03570 [Candidatus Kaiserbacteria bacterium RIFCSPHIGHO2_01_FULL_56_24]|uniref:Uncharacterized protein n=1 Tax=Candidatus Kaiserbacteria bacterium RIFCSPHIGHO2_01_FULL_56_24 TaxID=1798487 RepID=A0A1F6DH38_9BACT|nr:MAG: hypothetical protein A2765_03570 [Candidatus Kaiserbacteria bacterium RIFCSPHIGHO2_01_FULL_56_24]